LPPWSIELKEDPKTSKAFAVVQFEKVHDVETAQTKLDCHIFKGATLKAVRMTQVKQEAAVTLPRLIVRNLAFPVTDDDLNTHFGVHGLVAEALVVRLALDEAEHAPQGALGKRRGLGFVQYHAVADAVKAIEALNGFKLKGREMIVYFALAIEEEEEGEEGDEGEEAASEKGAPEPDSDAESDSPSHNDELEMQVDSEEEDAEKRR
jgi:nucleolar protein 4